MFPPFYPLKMVCSPTLLSTPKKPKCVTPNVTPIVKIAIKAHLNIIPPPLSFIISPINTKTPPKQTKRFKTQTIKHNKQKDGCM